MKVKYEVSVIYACTDGKGRIVNIIARPEKIISTYKKRKEIADVWKCEKIIFQKQYAKNGSHIAVYSNDSHYVPNDCTG